MADNVQDLTLQVLRQIRDEIVTTRTDLHGEIAKTNQRLDQTNQRLDESNQRLGHVETTLVDLAYQQVFVSKFVRSLASRDRDLGADVDELRMRMDALERRTPG